MQSCCIGLIYRRNCYILPHKLFAVAAPSARVRCNSTALSPNNIAAKEVERDGILFVDSVFPVQLGVWDIRHYLARANSARMIQFLKETLSKVHVHNFKVESIEPRIKDGGAFVKFKYTEKPRAASKAPTETPSLETDIKKAIHEIGGIRTWLGNIGGEAWLVRGKPWREDMRRYAASTVKVYFEGPDIYQETLYDIMRPYGQISDITNPVPVPAGNLRFSMVKFSTPRGATRAHNCIHGFTLVDEPAIPGTSSGGKPTRLATVYERRLKFQAAWEWASSHPRIVIPIVIFLLGTISYLIFDPIRTLSVQAKVMDWLEFSEFRIIKWVRQNTTDRIGFFRNPGPVVAPSGEPTHQENNWKDRKDAENALRAYLAETPSTIAFVHGPAGSGKTSMLRRVLKDANRRTLLIDCELLNRARSEADVIGELASQTGYWPVFSWLNSLTSLIDLASVGLGRQQSGLSTSVEAQFKEMLGVVGNALKGVSIKHGEVERAKKIAHTLSEQTEARAKANLEKMRLGTYHDPRIDTVAGTGVTSELGVGDENLTENDMDSEKKLPQFVDKATPAAQEAVEVNKGSVESKFELENKSRSSPASSGTSTGTIGQVIGAVQGTIKGIVQGSEHIVKNDKEEARKPWTGTKGQMDAPEEGEKHQPPTDEKKREVDEDIHGLPVVVIKNYATKTAFTEQLVTVLAEWAASLADGGVAHIVVLSDNRENGRRLEKALPSKPLASIALADADPTSALSFVQDKLRYYGIHSTLTREQKLLIERLGGRSSDLESLCHKVKNGMPVEAAVENIIARGVGELRKNAFGEDADDQKSMPWSQEQAYFILKLLSKSNELPYYDVLLNSPFKGNEAALRGMERAELISITTLEGRPSTIRPGKPVYRHVFERLVNDQVFRSRLDIALNEKAIASSEATIKACEEELLKLEQIRPLDSGILSIGATKRRADFLLVKLQEAERKIEQLEYANVKLKKGLKQP